MIRHANAAWPKAYAGLGTEWRLSGLWEGRPVEIFFASEDDAQAFAASEFGLSGTWADPDGDGNYCIVSS